MELESKSLGEVKANFLYVVQTYTLALVIEHRLQADMSDAVAAMATNVDPSWLANRTMRITARHFVEYVRGVGDRPEWLPKSWPDNPGR